MTLRTLLILLLAKQGFVCALSTSMDRSSTAWWWVYSLSAILTLVLASWCARLWEPRLAPVLIIVALGFTVVDMREWILNRALAGLALLEFTAALVLLNGFFHAIASALERRRQSALVLVVSAQALLVLAAMPPRETPWEAFWWMELRQWVSPLLWLGLWKYGEER